MNQMANVLNEKQASAYCGMSIPFLRRARMRGRTRSETPGPKFCKIGVRVLYRVGDLDAWLDAHVKESVCA